MAVATAEWIAAGLLGAEGAPETAVLVIAEAAKPGERRLDTSVGAVIMVSLARSAARDRRAASKPTRASGAIPAATRVSA